MEVTVAEPDWRLPKLDRELTGKPVSVGEISVHPLARLEFDLGGRGGQAGGAGSGGRLRLRPVGVIVRQEGQPPQQVAIGDVEGTAYRAMLATGAGVVAASIAFSIVMKLRTMQRKESRSNGLPQEGV